MRTKGLLPVFAVLLVLAAGCKAREPEVQSQASPGATTAATTTTTTAATTTAPPAAAPTPTPPATPPPAATPAPQATPAAATATTAVPAGTLASQTSNWPGIVVDVTEFRRKGTTLTARLVLRNQGNADAEPDIHLNEVYVMDAGGGKKYEVLKDENGSYIAALRPGYKDQWYQRLQPGGTYTIWMKFPAPPADVKTVTLQVPGVPPFEDLAIQDS